MAKNIEQLDPQVREKISNFLSESGHDINDLSEEQLTGLYWSVLNEEERETVTTYTPSDDDDDDITDAVRGADEEDVAYNDDGTISVKEEEIMEMVRQGQNPIMSKANLIEEIRRISEANKYEDEYGSGDNEYSKHLDSDSVNDMSKELYDDIRSAAEEKFGQADFDSASMAMARSLQNILMLEMNKKEELSLEAVRLIREKYGALTEDAVDIQAEITGHPQLGGRDITKGNVQNTRGTTPPPEGKTEEELKPEIMKRRIINGMTHGAARKGQNLFHMAGDVLGNLGGDAREDYSKIMAANDFLYWAMDKETIKDQSQEGVHAGNVKVIIDPDTRKPKIIAQGMTFSFLLHELTKGVMELMSLHGTSHDDSVRKYVEDKTDHLDAEPDDIRLGVGIWEKVSRFIDIDNPQHEALFYHKLVTLPAEEFNEIMRGLVAGNVEAVRLVQDIADEASESLSGEEYDNAMGTYDEPTEQPPREDDGFPDPNEPESEYSDPELERLLGGGSQEEQPTSSEPNYSEMSKPDLKRAMDDALDAGDFETAAKIGPYLH